MPNGQKRSNREIRKPKAAKPSLVSAPSFQVTALGSTMTISGQKKKR
jgi:hypothetical protein